ncbi:hypothetical protein KC19_VG129600 [Ceratodon purpureus]|uniref:Uncharacterized protein n=1 Tax=Ceratodon purpureus TaxID=3225 RepID=A0A8T0HPY1_CERPU|nr:hypothetical protein KC19_VG129600 [Ceratodon purpureus]
MAANSMFQECFGQEDDVMEVDCPSQSLKKLLAAKAKEKYAAYGNTAGTRKRARDSATTSMPSPLRAPPPICSVPDRAHRHKLWLEFAVMEKLAEDEGREPLLDGEPLQTES